MHDVGSNSCIAIKKPFLNDNHKVERLAFAKEHSYGSLEDWSKVIWTDEASFEIGKLSHQVHVWQKYHERYQWDCIVPSFKSKRSLIMVWDARTSSTKLYLVLIFPDKHTNFKAFYQHDNYEDLILMKDRVLVHGSNTPKI